MSGGSGRRTACPVAANGTLVVPFVFLPILNFFHDGLVIGFDCGRGARRDCGVKWKLFLRRLSVSAPSMKVRSRLPWPIRAAIALALLVLAAVGGLTLYEYGGDWSGPGRRELAAELERTRAQVRALQAERDRALAAAAGLELAFRHYQRVEGTVALPPGGVARSVLVRVMSSGRVIAQQSFSL